MKQGKQLCSQRQTSTRATFVKLCVSESGEFDVHKCEVGEDSYESAYAGAPNRSSFWRLIFAFFLTANSLS